MAVALGGAGIAAWLGLGLAGMFVALSASFVAMGLVNAVAFATGRMFLAGPAPSKSPVPQGLTAVAGSTR